MHLLAPLAAGMAGAAGGTVEVYARGTSTPITLYTDFEGTTTTSNPATLDANGRAKLYVSEYARCVVKNSSGSTLIDYVDGDDANNSELRSASIVGNAYVGGAAAAGNPISVEAAFDKLITSFGSTDFNVLLAGSSVTMQVALGALWRARVFDVKAYGALGDGATNDLNAINAASSAANTAGGGVVYFPPGTYNINAAPTLYQTVSMAGAGASVSTIRFTADVIGIGLNGVPRAVSDLSFTHSSATFNTFLYIPSGACLVRSCDFTATNAPTSPQISVASGGSVKLECCAVTSTGSSGYQTLVFPGGEAWFSRCVLSAASGVTISAGNTATPGSAESRVWVDGCRLVTTAGNVSTYLFARSGGNIVATGNVFVPGLQATVFYCEASDSKITESGNYLKAVADIMVTGYSNRIYYHIGGNIHAGSRDSVSVPVIGPDTTAIGVWPDAGSVVIRTTAGAGTRVIGSQGNFGQNGAAWRIAVHNDTGSSITYQWGTGFASFGSTFAVAANSVRAFSLIYITERAKWFLVSDTAGAETAE